MLILALKPMTRNRDARTSIACQTKICGPENQNHRLGIPDQGAIEYKLLNWLDQLKKDKLYEENNDQ